MQKKANGLKKNNPGKKEEKKAANVVQFTRDDKNRTFHMLLGDYGISEFYV